MIIGINLFQQLLNSRNLNNVVITSYIPFDNQVYGGAKSVMCNVFTDSFQQPMQNDSIGLYYYGSQEHQYIKNVNHLTYDSYVSILEQFKKIVDSYNLGISFRSPIELYAEYKATMDTVPASGLVNIISPNYETVIVDSDKINISIPGIFVNKLPINEFAKALYIIQPQLSLSVLTITTLYKIYNQSYDSNMPYTNNPLFSNNSNLAFLNKLADMAMCNIIRREVGKEEIVNKCMNSAMSSPELLEYAKYMMLNYNLSEKVAYQFLLYSSNNIKGTIETFNNKLGISEYVGKDRLILLGFNDKRMIESYNNLNTALSSNAGSLFTTF